MCPSTGSLAGFLCFGSGGYSRVKVAWIKANLKDSVAKSPVIGLVLASLFVHALNPFVGFIVGSFAAGVLGSVLWSVLMSVIGLVLAFWLGSVFGVVVKRVAFVLVLISVLMSVLGSVLVWGEAASVSVPVWVKTAFPVGAVLGFWVGVWLVMRVAHLLGVGFMRAWVWFLLTSLLISVPMTVVLLVFGSVR